MRNYDVLDMGFRNLLRRKTRTMLTVVGVVVGATAIIIMLSLGIGMNENLNKTIESMGDLTIIDINQYAWRPEAPGSNDYISAQNVLDAALLEKIRTWDGVLAVTPYFNYSDMSMRAGKRYVPMWINLTAIDSDFLPYLKLEADVGYMPQPGDTNWILFGSLRARMFYDEKKGYPSWKEQDAMWNPDYTKPPKIDITKEIITMQNPTTVWVWDPNTGMGEEKQLKGKLKKYELDKVGVIKRFENQYGYDDNEYQIYADYRIIEEMLIEREKLTKVKPKDSMIGKYDQIRVKVKDIKTAETIQKRLMEEEEIMLNWGLADERAAMQQSQGTMQLILGGIGAMSLLVAAIGIANTMFMSIYERTKEIGVMKVLGCPLGGIQSMFLFEASIIGFLGGVLGSGISLIGSYMMNNYEPFRKVLGNVSGSGNFYVQNVEQGNISVIPVWLILLSILFSTVIGLVSGYMPARRATKISALEAIRSE